MTNAPDILFEDNHLIIVNKSCSDLVQGDRTGDATLADRVREYLKTAYAKPGNVFLGIPHRLDRPVSGIVIYAKTSKALSRMTELFRIGEVTKVYWAVVCGAPPGKQGELVHFLSKNQARNKSYAVEEGGRNAKEARLKYRLLGASERYYLVEVLLETGRHHQIRVQLSSAGSVIKGDLKYGAPRSNPDGGISLHARFVSFLHPVTKEPVQITAPPPDDSLWNFFAGAYGDGIPDPFC